MSANGTSSAFQSTPPTWEATAQNQGKRSARYGFNPRLPRGRRRDIAFAADWIYVVFQSTPPTWEATWMINRVCYKTEVSIHASHVGGDAEARNRVACWSVSIHASHVGGDIGLITNGSTTVLFQSTPPTWEATKNAAKYSMTFAVSIHASHVGGDYRLLRKITLTRCFNPRLPRGRRPVEVFGYGSFSTFQSTPPTWEATATFSKKNKSPPIYGGVTSSQTSLIVCREKELVAF